MLCCLIIYILSETVRRFSSGAVSLSEGFGARRGVLSCSLVGVLGIAMVNACSYAFSAMCFCVFELQNWKVVYNF